MHIEFNTIDIGNYNIGMYVCMYINIDPPKACKFF